MPRKLREEAPGAIHHVYARGNDRRLIFRDDTDRAIYLHHLGRAVKRFAWRCLAYCLMDNHLHLLVETPRPTLGPGMQQLQGTYAQRHNSRHDRSGHLFQGRYGAVRVTSDPQLWSVAAYVARNPVEAALCARPEEWRWSSHAAVLGLVTPPDWLDVPRLLTHFRARGGDARARYAHFVA